MYAPSYLFVKRETLIYNEQMKAWQKLFPFFLNHGGTGARSNTEKLCVSVVYIPV